MLHTVRRLSTHSVRYNYVKQLYLNELQNASKEINISEIVKPEGNVINWKNITKPVAPKLEATDKELLDQYILSKPTIANGTDANSSTAATTTSEPNNANDDWLIVEEFVDDTQNSH